MSADDKKTVEDVHGYAARSRADTAETETCPACAGKRTVGMALEQFGTLEPVREVQVTCEHCNGSGRVPVKRERVKIDPFDKVRVVYTGDPTESRVELVSVADDGTQQVHDIPCSSIGIALDGRQSKLVMVVADSAFELTADVEMPTGMVSEVLRAAARFNNPDLRKTERQLVEDLEREIENARSNAVAAERELFEKHGILTPETMVLVGRFGGIREMHAEARAKADQLMTERFARVLRDRMSGAFDGVDEETRLELLGDLVRATYGKPPATPDRRFEVGVEACSDCPDCDCNKPRSS